MKSNTAHALANEAKKVGMDVLTENEIELLAQVRENDGENADSVVAEIINWNPEIGQYRSNMVCWAIGLGWVDGYGEIVTEDEEAEDEQEEIELD